jgi:hypothetical protein
MPVGFRQPDDRRVTTLICPASKPPVREAFRR